MEGVQYRAVLHRLADGNRLLALAGITESFVVVHYELARPVAHFRTGTSVFALEKESLKTVATIINGQETEVSLASDPCGGCVDPWNGPWTYESPGCSSYSYSCLFYCCGPCGVACVPFGSPSCLACVFIWCPICSVSCCSEWTSYCAACAS